MQARGFHFINNITGIGLPSLYNGEDAEFQYSFSHLALCVVNIHLTQLRNKNIFLRGY